MLLDSMVIERGVLFQSNSASENSTEDIYEDAQEELSADDRKRKQIIDLWYRPDARHGESKARTCISRDNVSVVVPQSNSHNFRLYDFSGKSI